MSPRSWPCSIRSRTISRRPGRPVRNGWHVRTKRQPWRAYASSSVVQSSVTSCWERVWLRAIGGRYAVCCQSSSHHEIGSSTRSPRLGLEHVGPVVVGEARVVGEPVLGEQRVRAPRGLPARSPVALRLDAVPAERLERALEVAPLLVLALVQRAVVRVAVVPDLVAGLEDPLDGPRVAVGRVARHEERRRHVVLRQQVEDPRDADGRAVGLVAHHRRVLRVAAALDEDHRLGVDVEREHDRRGHVRPHAYNSAPMADRSPRGNRAVKLSSADRVLFPDDGVTKGDLFDYYEAVAPAIVPHLRDRPFTMKRFREGIDKPGFFQKQAPKGIPEWIPTRQFRTWPREGGSRLVDFPLVNDELALLWMVQMHCIDMNAWYSRVDKPDRPDFVLFDLDPPDDGDDGFGLAIEVAHLIRELARRGRPARLGEDERRRRDPRRRADPAPLDLRADLRLRRARLAAARAAPPRQGHDRVAEAQARGRPRRPPPERLTARRSRPSTRCGRSRARRSRRRSTGTS